MVIKSGSVGLKIIYNSKNTEKNFSSKYRNKWKYPQAVEKKLMATENFINSANTLQDIVLYKPFRFHKLEGRRKHEWSIYLGNTGYRVTMIPCDENENEIIDGDIIAQCKNIKIIEITEVSNHYE